MDHFRGQEKELRACSLGFSQFAQGRKRSRDGNDNNGNTTVLFTHSQTLDHHHLQQQSTAQGRVPDPDRIITDPENPGAGFARSNSKTSSPPSIIYLECLKNHAASIGGNLLDGCGEFMPSGEEGSLEALKCAACECHRNFHRQEISGETNFRRSMLHSLQLTPSPLPLLQHQKFSTAIIVPPMQVAPYNTNTESSSEDLNAFLSGDVAAAALFLVSKKRFRTKFTQEQKEKFRNFVLRLGLKDKFLKLFSLVLVLSLLWFSHWCWFCQSGRSSRTVQRWKMGWTK